MNVLDTFAGAGGFSLGFEQSGDYTVVGAIEKDSWACETFQHNHPNAKVIVESLENLSDEEIKLAFPNIDVVLGGPPCQGFSIANRKALDAKDPRNSLFREFIRVGSILNPSIMIMENVPNLIKAKTNDKKLVIDIIIEELESLGYNVYHSILKASDYGVPQIRKRLFVIASKEPLKNPFPKQTHIFSEKSNLSESRLEKTPNLWDAISDLPEIDAREGEFEMNYTKNAENDYQIMMRKSSNKVYNHTSMKHSKRMVERFESMSWGESSANVPEHLKPLKRNGNGEISKKVYGQNNRRMFPLKPCHTIAASFYANFVHPYKNRNFTPREGARIQSFPDHYVFKGKPTVVSQKLLQKEERFDEKHLGQYNQIGNAVPPLLAQVIAENISKQLCTYTETI
tara:strand:- start:695 stop:1888 length:1194 start_codon:yes stop_codon:yes gene_type:complete